MMLNSHIQKALVFSILVFVIGFFFIILIPPFQSHDETHHFHNIVGLSELKLSRPVLSKEIVDFPYQFEVSRIAFHPYEKFHYENILKILNKPDWNFSGIKVKAIYCPYGPIPYIFQSLVYFFIENIDKSPRGTLIAFYLMRLMTLLLSCTVLFFAFRILKKNSWIALLVALTPMAINDFSTLNADWSILTLTILTAACCVQHEFEKRYFLISLLACSGIVLSKFLYFPIFLLPVLYALKSERPRRAYWCLFLAILLPVLLISGTLTFLNYTPHPARIGIVNVKMQLRFILSSPITFGKILISTFYHQRSFLTESFIGNLGWLDNPLPKWAYLLWPFIFIAGFFYPLLSKKAKITDEENRGEKSYFVFAGGFIFISLVIILLIAISFYLSWSPPYAQNIEGLQGRHFHSALIIGSYGFYLFIKKFFQAKEMPLSVIVICGLVINIAAIVKIIWRYW